MKNIFHFAVFAIAVVLLATSSSAQSGAPTESVKQLPDGTIVRKVNGGTITMKPVKKESQPAVQPEAKTEDRSASTAAEDYTKGFEKFSKLGLPDVSSAVYVKLNAHGLKFYSGRNSIYWIKGVKGNAWMLSEDKKGRSKFVTDESSVVEVLDSKTYQEERSKKIQEEVKKQKESGSGPADMQNIFMDFSVDMEISGDWFPVDLKADVQSVTNALVEKNAQTEKYQRLIHSNEMGQLFLFAIHVSQKGMKDDANKIVSLLFENAGGSKNVILAGLNQLANSQYDDVFRTYQKDGDIKNYSNSIDALLAKFPAGWLYAPALKKLNGILKNRIAAKTAPELTGEGMTDEDKKLASELADAKDSDMKSMNGYGSMMMFRGAYGSGGLWIFGDTASKGRNNARKNEEPGAFQKIQMRGMKSVPLLIALLKDDWPTQIMDDSNSRFSFSDLSSVSESELKNIYRSISRPLTRGEIAQQMLASALLSEDGENSMFRHSIYDEDNLDEFAETCREWYIANKDKSQFDLAKSYLENGDDFQKQEAVSRLISLCKGKDASLVEEYFLNAEQPMNSINLVFKYVEGRGSEAKPFVDKFIKLIKPDKEQNGKEKGKNGKKTTAVIKKITEVQGKESATEAAKTETLVVVDGVEAISPATLGELVKAEAEDSFDDEFFIEDNDSQNEYRQKEIEGAVKHLNMLVSNENVSDIVAKIAASASADDEVVNSYEMRTLAMKKLKKEPIDKAVSIVLEEAIKSNAKEARVRLLNMLPDLNADDKSASVYSFSAVFGDEDAEEGDGKAVKEKADISKTRHLWEKIINDLKDEELDSAIIAVEMLYGSPDETPGRTAFSYDRRFKLSSLLSQLGPKFRAFAVDRMKQRIAGKVENELPPLPSADKVDDTRKKEITGMLIGAPSENLRKVLDGLSFDEMLVLGDLAQDSKPLNEKLFPLSNEIVEINMESKTLKDGGKILALKGGQLQKSHVQMIQELCLTAVSALPPETEFSIRIIRRPTCSGTEIKLTEKIRVQKAKAGGAVPPSPERKFLHASVYGMPDIRESSGWMIKAEDAGGTAAKDGSKSEEDELLAEMEDEFRDEQNEEYIKSQKNFWTKVEEFCSPKSIAPSGGGIYFSKGAGNSGYFRSYRGNSHIILD